MKISSKWMSGLCAASALCVLTACNNGHQYTINGTLSPEFFTQIDSVDRVISLVSLPDNDTLNTVQIDEDGNFTLTGTVDQPNLVNLALGEMGAIVIALEPGEIQVELGEGYSVTGTEANEAMSEYNTLSRDLEELYTEVLYAARDSAEAVGAEVDYLGIINEYTYELTHMTDSVYEANSQNLAGVYLAMIKMQHMSSVEEVHTTFDTNHYVMQNPIVKKMIELIEEYSKEGPQEFEPEDMGPADSTADLESSEGSDAQ